MLYGTEMFKEDGDIFSQGTLATIWFFASLLLEVILSIYTLVLMTIGLSVVQKMSIGKAILNLFLPIFVIVLPILLIAGLFSLA